MKCLLLGQCVPGQETVFVVKLMCPGSSKCVRTQANVYIVLQMSVIQTYSTHMTQILIQKMQLEGM